MSDQPRGDGLLAALIRASDRQEPLTYETPWGRGAVMPLHDLMRGEGTKADLAATLAHSKIEGGTEPRQAWREVREAMETHSREGS